MAGHPRGTLHRGWIALLVSVVVVLGTFPAFGADQDRPPREVPIETARQKVEPELLDGLRPGEQVDFLVEIEGSADLSAASEMTDWSERGWYVYDTLREHAEDAQAEVRAHLDAMDVVYTAFWIANVIHVTGGLDTIDALAARPEVESIVLAQDVPLPEPAPGEFLTQQAGPTWGLEAVGAPQVWSQFGTRGEGIVIGVIDSGAQHDHPALVGAYRGTKGNGTFDHAYNWYDPLDDCPTDDPCDQDGHGTHVTGTAVGDDGAANQIGVAPGARWIAAKGCQVTTCNGLALLQAGQWMLAPTDGDGGGADPDRRPHVVNNSWGGDGGILWYDAWIDAWIQAGMFPMFAAGNSGPACGSASSPGDYPQSYSSGGFDSTGAVYTGSGRGPSLVDGGIKPNISAPSVGVRSSVPGGGYATWTGTSMGAPHVSGTVALLWSAASELVGDIAATRSILDGSALDTANAQCGGTAGRNNVFGEGRLDAHAAVVAATSDGGEPGSPPPPKPPNPPEPDEPEPDDPTDPEGPRFVDPDPGFRLGDIPVGHLFDFEIHWLAANEITRGCNPPENTRFCPDDTVTRGQMAAFLVRALSLPPGTTGFDDTQGHTFEHDTAALAAADITRGCNPPHNTRFCPNDPVTRGQMAAFLYRALGR